MSFDFSEPQNPFEPIAKLAETDANASTNKEERLANIAAVNSFLNMGNGKLQVRINKMNVPTIFLSTDVWKHGAPEMADIDYDLLRDLSGYYMTAGQINASIKLFSEQKIQPGGSVSLEMSVLLNSYAVHHNDYVAEIQKKNVVLLKDSIEKEILRLSILRSKIVEKAQ